MKKTIRNKNNKSKNNKSKNNKSKNNKSNKITYILDLDQTLLHSEFNNKELNNNHKVYYRPYLKKLLDFFEKNKEKYNLGFWSTGTVNYVKNILKTLLKKYKDLPVIIILARSNISLSQAKESERENPVIENVLTGEQYPFYFHKEVYVKNIKHFLNLKSIKEKYNFNKNTILVDDYVPNIDINKKENIYAVPPWLKFMKSDNELLKLMQCIKKKGKCTRKNT